MVPRIWGARNRANDTARISDIRSITSALIQYQLDFPKYPANGEVCSWAANTAKTSVLTWANYGLGWVVPVDPITQECYSYRRLNSNGDHFVVCAHLSDGSTAGNAAQDLAALNYSKDTYKTVLEDLSSSGQYYCYVW